MSWRAGSLVAACSQPAEQVYLHPVGDHKVSGEQRHSRFLFVSDAKKTEMQGGGLYVPSRALNFPQTVFRESEISHSYEENSEKHSSSYFAKTTQDSPKDVVLGLRM